MIKVLEPDRRTVPSPFGGGCTDSGVVSCLLRKLVEYATTIDGVLREERGCRVLHTGEHSTHQRRRASLVELTLHDLISSGLAVNARIGKYLCRCVPRMQWEPAEGYGFWKGAPEFCTLCGSRILGGARSVERSEWTDAG